MKETTGMTLDEFWALIEDARRGADPATDELADRLVDRLAAMPPGEIESFNRHLAGRRHESYRWDLWAVAYIMNGGCSDDGFDYFRGWLVSKGRKFYENALATPARAARGVSEDEAPEYEAILYAAGTAYERATGRELPPTGMVYPPDPAGTKWEEDDLPKLFPKLCERFDF